MDLTTIITAAVGFGTLGAMLLSGNRRLEKRVMSVETGLTVLDKSVAELDKKTERIDTKIDAVDARLAVQIDAVDARLTAQIDAVDARLTAQIDAVDKRLTAGLTHLDTKIDAVGADVAVLDARLHQLATHVGQSRLPLRIMRA